jgi:hypothetical protein
MRAPVMTTSCCDCGVGTITSGEWYMVKDEIWASAWTGRPLKPHHALPGQMVLCIGCLEQRLGRTLMACDFTDAPVNSWEPMSARMRDRVTAKRAIVNGADSLVAWAVEAMLQRLPDDRRAAARQAWERMQG